MKGLEGKNGLEDCSQEDDPKMEDRDRDNLLKCIETRDLIEYGLIPEFVGRFPVITALHSLDENMLMKILVEPPNSIISQYKYLFSLDQVNVFLGIEVSNLVKV